MEVDKVADIVVMKPNEDLTDMTLVVDMYVDKVAGNGWQLMRLGKNGWKWWKSLKMNMDDIGYEKNSLRK